MIFSNPRRNEIPSSTELVHLSAASHRNPAPRTWLIMSGRELSARMVQLYTRLGGKREASFLSGCRQSGQTRFEHGGHHSLGGRRSRGRATQVGDECTYVTLRLPELKPAVNHFWPRSGRIGVTSTNCPCGGLAPEWKGVRPTSTSILLSTTSRYGPSGIRPTRTTSPRGCAGGLSLFPPSRVLSFGLGGVSPRGGSAA